MRHCNTSNISNTARIFRSLLQPPRLANAAGINAENCRNCACILILRALYIRTVLCSLSFCKSYLLVCFIFLRCPIFCSARFSRMVYLVLRYVFAAVYLLKDRVCFDVQVFVYTCHCRTNLKLRIASSALVIKINFVWHCDWFCFCRKLCQTEMMIVSVFSIFLR